MKKLLSLILSFCSMLSFAAQMPVQATEDGLVIMLIDGKINHYDGQQFINIAEAWRLSGYPIQTVFLNSGGGSVISGYQIANYITRYGIQTIVMNGDICASSCFNIFLAGKPRVADLGSRIGVHRISQNTFDTDSARSYSIDMSAYYKSMNVPNNIRLAMLETPPEKIYWLNPNEIKEISHYQLNVQEAISVLRAGGVPESKSTITNNSKQIAKRLNKEAIPLIWDNNLSLAISKLEQAKQYDPSNSEVLGNLGFAYQRMGDLRNAQINFTASLKLTPKRGATWGNLADLLADTGQISWATQAYINYYTYSKNKQAALNLFYSWMQQYPNTGRDIAVRQAMARLGLQ